jgi:hypothetical protein
MRFLTILSIFLISPLFAGAQFSANSLLETNLSIESSPEYPAPGDTVSLSLNDYGGTAYGADVNWYLNGNLIPGTDNERNIQIQAGAVGKENIVKAVLKRSDSTSLTLTKSFTPMFIDIIAEPETHVPGFYEGRSLPSAGSTVRLTALLDNGTTLNPSGYVFLWKVNQTVLEGGPLRGRNTITFTMPQDSYSVVSLQISKPDGTIVGKRSTIIPVTNPQIHFYEVNALYGIEAKSLSRFNMVGNSSTIIAEPYYLDSRTFNAPNLLEWKINSDRVSGDQNNPYTVTLEKTGYPGRAKLEFHVRNTTSLLQGASKGIEINI